MKKKLEKRDNLMIRAMAKYSAISDGDVLQFEFIQNKLIEKP